MSFENNSLYAGSPLHRWQGVIKGDMRMSGRLSCLRSEKSVGGFSSRYNYSLFIRLRSNT